MLPRIWIVLLTLLLLAAPVNSAFAEIVDDQSSISLCDDDPLEPVEASSAEAQPERIACAARLDDDVLPTPELARVFRPPRPSFD